MTDEQQSASPPTEAKAPELSLPQIVEAARHILAEAPAGQPMLMSKLGLRLATALGGNIRLALGQRRLREVLSSSLGDLVQFDGSAASLSVRLNSQAPGTQRFDAALWAAFAKPIADGKVRHLKPTRRIDFEDHDLGANPRPGWLEVDRQFVPDIDLPKPARESAISKSIYAFADRHGLSVADLLVAARAPASAAPSPVASDEIVQPVEGRGIARLLQLIEAVPPSERAKFSLPLDLLHRLLTL